MSKHLDDFSRKLAGGMSRRKAFWQLLTGAGGIGLTAAKPLPAVQQQFDPSCPTICFQQSNLAFMACVDDTLASSPSTPFGIVIAMCLGAQTDLYQQCLIASQSCPPGQCATVNYTITSGDLVINSVTCGIT